MGKGVEGVTAAAVSGQKALERVKGQVERLVGEWIGLLGLSDYDIQVGFEPSSPNNRGQCSMSERYRRVELDFDAGVVLEEPEEAEELVVHELVHVLLGPMSEEIDRWVERAMDRGFELDGVERSRVRDVVEGAVSRVSRGLVVARERE